MSPADRHRLRRMIPRRERGRLDEVAVEIPRLIASPNHEEIPRVLLKPLDEMLDDARRAHVANDPRHASPLRHARLRDADLIDDVLRPRDVVLGRVPSEQDLGRRDRLRADHAAEERRHEIAERPPVRIGAVRLRRVGLGSCVGLGFGDIGLRIGLGGDVRLRGVWPGGVQLRLRGPVRSGGVSSRLDRIRLGDNVEQNNVRLGLGDGVRLGHIRVDGIRPDSIRAGCVRLGRIRHRRIFPHRVGPAEHVGAANV
ncbi:MAG: hypothetical protein R3F39_03805 [Myxococcota bacterium]